MQEVNEFLLRVEAPHFVAGAVFHPVWYYDKTELKCVKAAPIIKWMVGLTLDEIYYSIRKKDWKTEWISCNANQEKPL